MPPVFILANFTAESLAMRLRTLGLDARTLPGFDTWRQELLNPKSALWEEPGVCIFIILNDVSGPDKEIEIIREAVKSHPDSTIIVSTLDIQKKPAAPLTGHDASHEAAQSWRLALEKLNVPILDLENLIMDVGRENFYNAKTWYFGALPFSASGEKRLAGEIARVVNIIRHGRKKCLVLDLDGVMWGGVIGEDGLDGIALSASGIGGVYRDVQLIAKELSRQGVLLAINSKNNLDDAMLPFRKHSHAVLSETDFSSVKVNWEPKPQNIFDIAKELNIGTDSLVFIDDNPVEREAVKAACPDVTVPDFPKDTASLPAFMRGVANTYFTALTLGTEDTAKSEMYRAEARRNAEKQSYASLDDYLKSLDMKLDLHLLKDDEVARAAQLCAKTNQFNLTTKRYTEADIRAMMSDARYRIYIASLTDKYGDYGRIALVIAELTGQGTEKEAHIDTLLMSCRAMGRGVETEILSWTEELLGDEGVNAVTGRYVPTEKNAPVKDFWYDMGYTCDGGKWMHYAPFPNRKTFVERT